jgi:VanZ family protein
LSLTSLEPHALRRIWLAAGWFGVVGVVVLSLIPPPPEMLGVENEDKLGHIAAYGLLMWWFAQDVLAARRRAGMALALIALGVALEFLQGWGGLRSFSVADMVADAAGVAVGWALAPPRLPNLLQRVTVALHR